MSEQKTGLSLKTPPIYVQAGPRRVTAAFIQRFEGPNNDLIAPIDHTMADTEIGTAYGITTLPHLRSLNIVGPMRVTGVSDTPEPPPRSSPAARRRPTTKRRARGRSCGALATRGVPRTRRRPAVRAADALLRGRPQGAQFRVGRRARARGDPGEPAVPVPARAAAGDGARRGSRTGSTDLELASRLSFFLWDAAPDAELARARRGAAARSSDEALARQVKRMLADPRAEALVDAVRRAVAPAAGPRQGHAGSDPVPVLRQDARRRVQARDGALLRQHRPRGPQRPRPASPPTTRYANERIARHYGIPNVAGNEFRRVTLPARPARPARPGQHPDADVEPRSHLARAARQVGARSAARIAAASAAAQRAGARGDQRDRGRQGAVGAAADGRAPREPGVQLVPPRDRSDRAVARELRCRPAAGASRTARPPSTRAACSTTARRMDGPAGLRAAILKHQDMFLRSFTREPDDVRARPPRRGAGHAVGARASSTTPSRAGYRLSSFVQGVVDEPGVPHERAAEPPATPRRRRGRVNSQATGGRSDVSHEQASVAAHAC